MFQLVQTINLILNFNLGLRNSHIIRDYFYEHILILNFPKMLHKTQMNISYNYYIFIIIYIIVSSKIILYPVECK